MSLRKLSAGYGYTYLTRQVAAHDVTHRGRDGLAGYYAERGESPGVWLGSAAHGRDGFPSVGQAVSEAQMVALFGEGRHPNAEVIEASLIAAGRGVRDVLVATKLSAAFRAESAAGAFRSRLAAAHGEWDRAAGQPVSAAVPESVRARLRTDLARVMFAEQHGRAPVSGTELAAFVARVSRPTAVPVAGYDLTFTPVKSVSALWAVAAPGLTAVVEQAHRDAVADTLGWLERQAAYTRLGRNGVRQVEVRGLLVVAFTHRDSRAGDPNLHTHVAVSNKVQTLDGRWRALDGRPLHALATAASERYNTRLEALLVDRLGVSFADRLGTPAGKRAVREIAGMAPRLLEVWSSRRAAIDSRRAELAARFQAEHGRPPTPVEASKLAQQATLQTRQAKHEPRSHAEQRATWRADAEQALGGARHVEAMLDALPRARTDRGVAAAAISAGWVADTAQTVVDVLQSGRATWREAHVRAEAERQARTAQVPLAQVDDAVERVVAGMLSPALSVPLGPPDPDASGLPAALRRADGSSVHTVAGSRLFSSPQVLAAEQQLLALAADTDGRTVSPTAVERAVRQSAEAGLVLKDGQTALVRDLATSGARVQLALAPAGTGKTTALRALAAAWTAGGGTVLGLAPSAAAAAVLAAELNGPDSQERSHAPVPADTLAKLLWSLDHLDDRDTVGRVPDWVRQVGPGSLVLIDEAGMAGTLDLARAAAWICDRGGSVRLVGDDRQLAAVGAGGVLRDLARTSGAAGRLHDVVRFSDPAEGAAGLALRVGDPVALGFYLDRQRVHSADPDGAVEEAYTAWAADRTAGRDSLLLAPTRDLALQLNTRARADRLAETTAGGAEVALGDGTRASAGDTILTRRNDRRLVVSPTDWVKNGDRWTVTDVLPDGALRAVHSRSQRSVILPAEYVAEHVTLGYASTVHTVLTGREDRQLLYVALTRGRTGNHLYLQTADVGDEHTPPGPDTLRPPTPAETLTRILARDGAQTSAVSTQQALDDPAALLGGDRRPLPRQPHPGCRGPRPRPARRATARARAAALAAGCPGPAGRRPRLGTAPARRGPAGPRPSPAGQRAGPHLDGRHRPGLGHPADQPRPRPRRPGRPARRLARRPAGPRRRPPADRPTERPPRRAAGAGGPAGRRGSSAPHARSSRGRLAPAAPDGRARAPRGPGLAPFRPAPRRRDQPRARRRPAPAPRRQRCAAARRAPRRRAALAARAAAPDGAAAHAAEAGPAGTAVRPAVRRTDCRHTGAGAAADPLEAAGRRDRPAAQRLPELAGARRVARAGAPRGTRRRRAAARARRPGAARRAPSRPRPQLPAGRGLPVRSTAAERRTASR